MDETGLMLDAAPHPLGTNNQAFGPKKQVGDPKIITIVLAARSSEASPTDITMRIIDMGASGRATGPRGDDWRERFAERNARMRADRAKMTVAQIAEKYRMSYHRAYMIVKNVKGPRG